MKNLKAILLTLFILINQVASTIAAHTEFFVDNATGSNLNSGQGGTVLTYAGGTFVRATGVFTVASGDPVADGIAVGDFASIYTTAGATVPGLIARVTGRTTTTITVSLTAMAGATASVSETAAAATLKRGGAIAGPSGTTDHPFNFITAALTDASGNIPKVWVKGGTDYAATDTITHSLVGPVIFEGYTTTPGDGGKFKITGNTGTAGVVFELFAWTGANITIRNVVFDGNFNGSPGGGIATGNFMVNVTGLNAILQNFEITGAYRFGLQGSSGGSLFIGGDVYGNNYDDASDMGGIRVTEESAWWYVKSRDNIGVLDNTDCVGWDIATASGETTVLAFCIAENNSKYGFQVRGSSSQAFLFGCAGVNNTDSGFFTSGTAGSIIVSVNSVWGANGVYGMERGTSADGSVLIRNNGFWGNGTAQTLNINTSFLVGTITLSGDPFVDYANGNYALDDTAGQGAALRAAGYAPFVQGDHSANTISYVDVGPAQHQDSGGGGGGGTRVYVGN